MKRLPPRNADGTFGKIVDMATHFWTFVDRSDKDGCWLWNGSERSSGYGQFWANGKPVSAHRYSWGITYGPIPKGKCVCHKCDTPRCVRPEHLFVGTMAENNADKAMKNRAARLVGEQNPMTVLTVEDVKAIRSLNGKMTQRMIANMFGVAQGHVHRIINRTRWTWVT